MVKTNTNSQASRPALLSQSNSSMSETRTTRNLDGNRQSNKATTDVTPKEAARILERRIRFLDKRINTSEDYSKRYDIQERKALELAVSCVRQFLVIEEDEEQ